jgi:hypothetical protein
MRINARLSYTVDDAAKIIVLKFIGDITGEQIVDTYISKLVCAHDPWLYDFIVDHRAHSGLFSTKDMEKATAQWNALCQGRDKGRISVIVTTDPHIIARIPLTRAAAPQRRIEVFEDFDSALDFLNTHGWREPQENVA